MPCAAKRSCRNVSLKALVNLLTPFICDGLGYKVKPYIISVGLPDKGIAGAKDTLLNSTGRVKSAACRRATAP